MLIAFGMNLMLLQLLVKNIWCYPGNYHPIGITVLKENKFNDVKIPDNILGICTYFSINWRNYFV